MGISDVIKLRFSPARGAVAAAPLLPAAAVSALLLVAGTNLGGGLEMATTILKGK